MGLMNRIVLSIVVVSLAVLGWWFSPWAQLQDPSVSRDYRILQCNGKFTAGFTVKNNLTIQQGYTLSNSRGNNFNPDPPAVSPGNRQFAANEKYSGVRINGSLVDACVEGRTTLHVEASDVDSVSNDFDNTFGPVKVKANPPTDQPASPDFGYTFTLSCCDLSRGVFHISDSASEHIGALRFKPASINCAVKRTKEITVTGVLERGEEHGVIDLGLKRDGAINECHLLTSVSRAE